MKSAYFSGFNGFRQFGSAHARKVLQPTEFSISELEGSLLYSFSWAFNVYASGNQLVIQGFQGEEPTEPFKVETEHPVKTISSNDNYCLVLLENGDIYKLNIRTKGLEKLNLFHGEVQRKRTIFGELKEEPVDRIEHVACGTSICVAISRNNAVYNLPFKVHEFPKHEKVKSLVCGFEHALVLNSNGDVYAWGNGLRGQLGLANMGIKEAPTLIEALAGIKILSISAGGWHSAAISAFGDLYTWGSNVNGQLGLRVYKLQTLKDDTTWNKKNPTVYPLPQLLEPWPCCNNENSQTETACNTVKVICGARHTFVQNSCGKLFCCGWNEHGQLGLNSLEDIKDHFTLLDFSISDNLEVLCGPWCTVLMVK